MQLHTCTHSRVPLLPFSFPLILLLSTTTTFLLSLASFFLYLISFFLYIFGSCSPMSPRVCSIFSPGLDSDIGAGYVRTHVYTHRILYIYIYCALVFSVFIASYHLPFFRDSLLFRGGADRSPFFRGIIYPSKIIRLIIEELVSRSSGGGRGV